MKLKRLIVLWSLFCAALAQSFAGDLLNVDFTTEGNPAFRTKLGAAAIGLDETDQWNANGPLKWSDGTASSVNITISGSPWYTWHFDPMFQSYLYSGESIPFSIINLPADTYDFYIYAHGQPAEEFAEIAMFVGATSIGTKRTSGAPDWNKPDWSEGDHYVVFRDVPVPAGTSVHFLSRVTRSGIPAVLNGMQIIRSAYTNFPPVISEEARHQTVIEGGSVQLAPKVIGNAPLQFQWKKNGENIAGANTRVLELASAQAADAATYTLAVTNEFGDTLSAGAVVTVLAPTTGPLINIDLTDETIGLFDAEKVGPAAIGASNTDVWNRMSRQVQTSSLNFADGSTNAGSALLRGVSAGVPAWFTENRDPMFVSYLGPTTAPTLDLISDVDPGKYDVYVYAHGRLANENTVITLTANGVSTTKSTSSSADWNKPKFTEGDHYVLFKDVIVPTGRLTLVAAGDGDARASLNGVQLRRTGGVPPLIETQPATVQVAPGQPFSVSVTATGTSLQYQWQKDGNDLLGETNATYSVAAAGTEHAGSYRVVITNPEGTTTSDAAIVTVRLPAPVITTHPASSTVVQGDPLNLGVVATGEQLSYQWELNGAPIEGATGSQYSISAVGSENAGAYRVKVSNPGGEVWSQTATVAVEATGFSLVNVNFGHQDMIKVGKAATGIADTDYWNHYSFPFQSFGAVTNLKTANNVVTGMGLTALNGPGQWYNLTGDKMYDSYLYSDNDITVTLHNVPAGRYNLFIYGHGITDNFNTQFGVTSGGIDHAFQATTKTPAWSSLIWQRNIQYVLFEQIDAGGTIVITCRRDGHSQAVINGIQLQRLATRSPLIYQQPASLTVRPDANVSFSVIASGENLSYQWRHAGTNLTESAHHEGVTTATLKVNAVDEADAGDYSVVVSNAHGEAVSSTATLAVTEFVLIDVNFGHETQIKTGVAATGISSADYWNHYNFPHATTGTILNLKMVDSVATAADLTVLNAPGQWYLSPPLGDMMYDSYVYSGGQITATISDLEPGSYDIFVYGHADVDSGNSVISVASGPQNFGTQATTTAPGAWKSIVWQRNAQYVLFENVIVSSEPVVITVAPGNYGQAFLNGLQIRSRGDVPPGPPTIIQQPRSLTISETRSAELSVFAWGSGTLTYQWRHEGTNIPAATNSNFSIASAALTDAGAYDVIITGSEGSTTSATVTLTVEGADREAPVVTITSPAAGARADERFTLEGTATDNQKIVSLTWELNGTQKGALALVDGKFSLPNQSLIKGVDNVIRVTARDDFDNAGVAQVITFWQAARTFVLNSPPATQEGARVNLPLTLASAGDVSGSTFTVAWDTNYLADPQFEWADSTSSGFTSAVIELGRRYRATFALPAVTVPSGTSIVATVSFRARSVSAARATPVTLALVDVYGASGDQFTTGNDMRSASVSITRRKIKGDNNANDRLDVGDASVMMSLIGVPLFSRPWDISNNDLNSNTTLDSGDVIKVLRTVVGLDPQPQVPVAPLAKKTQAAESQEGGGSGVITDNPPPVGPVRINLLVPDKATAAPGEKVTVELQMHGQTAPISGASFRLEYPVEALRLENATAHQVGPMPGSGAISIWNVAPNQTNYATQNGAVSLAVSSPRAWQTNNGVLARFTFTVQPDAASRYGWPIEVKNLEISRDGFNNEQLDGAFWTFTGHAPTQPAIVPAITFSADGRPQLSLQGDIGAWYTIHASTDLRTWRVVGEFYSTSGTLTFEDPQAGGANAVFYRAVQRIY